MRNKTYLLLLLIVLLGAFFRFYKLDWGNGIFPHPDENTVTTSVLQLSFPDQMHPHLFTYGSVITYSIYFIKETFDNLFTTSVHPLLIGRLLSAIFSTLTIILVYILAKRFTSTFWGLLAATFTALSPGLIQQAHFATPETFQTFFIILNIYLLFLYMTTKKTLHLLLLAVVLGLALGTKISSLYFAPTLLVGLLLTQYKKPLHLAISLLFVGIVSLVTLMIVSPYIFLDFETFKGIVEYESKIASGEIQVFYTRQFMHTVPVIFQLQSIFPYVLGPGLFIASLAGLFISIFNSFKYKDLYLTVLLLGFFTLFIPNSLLFVKWTRYMIPVLPLMIIFSVIGFFTLYRYAKKAVLALVVFIFLTTFLWTSAFFSIYTKDDVRAQATKKIQETIPPNSILIVEGANTVDVPLQGNYQLNSLFLYDLDTDPIAFDKLTTALERSDYFIVQSRRVFMNHLRLEKEYPQVSRFYQKLFNGELGFEKQRTISSFPSFTFFGLSYHFADEQAEETWTVFDHPVIRIYHKRAPYKKLDYERILQK